jgi:hypothetical protein
MHHIGNWYRILLGKNEKENTVERQDVYGKIIEKCNFGKCGVGFGVDSAGARKS